MYVRPTVSAVTVSGLAAPALLLATPPFDDAHVAL